METITSYIIKIFFNITKERGFQIKNYEVQDTYINPELQFFIQNCERISSIKLTSKYKT